MSNTDKNEEFDVKQTDPRPVATLTAAVVLTLNCEVSDCLCQVNGAL